MSRPYRKMVIENQTVAEVGCINAGGTILKFRIKRFLIENKNGERIAHGPCLSIQQFNTKGHFLKAVSFRTELIPQVIAMLERARLYNPQGGKK